MDFQGRVAIVTGGSGALGSTVALDLAGNGARVAVPYTADEHWAALENRAGSARERLWGAKADLTQAAAVERFVADVTTRWGRVDFLVHAHCILPGTMDTKANRRDMPRADFSQWVSTDDVARVIRFLLSDDARAVRSVAVPVLGP